jgi:hypothetical protein
MRMLVYRNKLKNYRFTFIIIIKSKRVLYVSGEIFEI